MEERCTSGVINLNFTTSECYKCHELMNISWIEWVYDDGSSSKFYGPELFDNQQIKLAMENDVIIENIFSHVMKEHYNANICHNCGSFFGEFYIHECLYRVNKSIEIGRFDEDEVIKKTLEYYNNNAVSHLDERFLIEFESLQNILLKYLNQGDHILDLGCGIGKDSKIFKEKGYRVTAYDGSTELCEIARKNIGQKVECKRFYEIKNRRKFNAIWANASLHHLPEEYLDDTMHKLYNGLKQGGYMYASFKYGDFEGMKDGRYYTYMTKKRMKSISAIKYQFEIIEMGIVDDERDNREDEKWIYVILKKTE